MIELPDYFDSLVEKARARSEKAMVKFPQPNYVLNKVAEESGEVIKAVIHYTEGRETWANVEAELIDNLAMLIRLVKEGDQVIGFTPPAEVHRLNASAQPVSDGWVSVPRSLTAENGAKAALLGEFSVKQNIVCHECLGEGCDDCNGQGHWISSIPVDWTTIKEIWAKGVEHFSPAAPGGQD